MKIIEFRSALVAFPLRRVHDLCKIIEDAEQCSTQVIQEAVGRDVINQNALRRRGFDLKAATSWRSTFAGAPVFFIREGEVELLFFPDRSHRYLGEKEKPLPTETRSAYSGRVDQESDRGGRSS